jgi:hypothetical protein
MSAGERRVTIAGDIGPDWNAGPRRSFFIAGTPKAYRSTGSDIKLTCQSAFGNSLTVIELGGKPARRTP